MSDSNEGRQSHAVESVRHHPYATTHKIRIKLGALKNYIEHHQSARSSPTAAVVEQRNVVDADGEIAAAIGKHHHHRNRTISDEVNNGRTSSDQSSTPAPQNLFDDEEAWNLSQKQLVDSATNAADNQPISQPPNDVLQNYFQQLAAAACSAGSGEVKQCIANDSQACLDKSPGSEDARSEEANSDVSLSVSAPVQPQADDDEYRQNGTQSTDVVEPNDPEVTVKEHAENLGRPKKRKQLRPQMHLPHLKNKDPVVRSSSVNSAAEDNVDNSENNNNVLLPLRSSELTPNRMMKRTVSSSMLNAMMGCVEAGIIKRPSLPQLIIDEDEKEGYEMNVVLDDEVTKFSQQQLGATNAGGENFKYVSPSDNNVANQRIPENFYQQQQTVALAHEVLTRQTANIMQALRWSLPASLAPVANLAASNNSDPNVRTLFDAIKEQMHASLDKMVEEILHRLSHNNNNGTSSLPAAPQSLNCGSSSSSSTHSAANSSTGGGKSGGTHASSSSEMMMNVSPSETHSPPIPLAVSPPTPQVIAKSNDECVHNGNVNGFVANADNSTSAQQPSADLTQKQQQASLAANLPFLANLMPSQNGGMILPQNLSAAQMDLLSQRLLMAADQRNGNFLQNPNNNQAARSLSTVTSATLLQQNASPLPTTPLLLPYCSSANGIATHSSSTPTNHNMPRFFSPTLLHHRNVSAASAAAGGTQNNNNTTTIAALLQQHESPASKFRNAMFSEENVRNGNKKKPKVTDSRIMASSRLGGMNIVKTQLGSAMTPLTTTDIPNQQFLTDGNGNNISMSLANNNFSSVISNGTPATMSTIAQLQNILPQNVNNNNTVAAVVAAAQQQQNAANFQIQHQQQLLLQQLHLQQQQQQQQQKAAVGLLNNPFLQAAAAAGLPVNLPPALAAMLAANGIVTGTSPGAATTTTNATTTVTSAFQQQQNLLNGVRHPPPPASISHLESMLRGVVSAAAAGGPSSANNTPNGAQVALIAANLEQHLRQAAAAASSNSHAAPNFHLLQQQQSISLINGNDVIRSQQPPTNNNRPQHHQQLRAIIQQQVDMPTQAPQFNNILAIQQEQQLNHHHARHRRHNQHNHHQQQRENGASSSAAGSLKSDGFQQESTQFDVNQLGSGGGGGSEGGTPRQMTSMTPMHLRKAKLMFFYNRYPNSTTLKTFFPDIRFNKQNTAQLVKWFSNFREFYYQQIEKQARTLLQDGVVCPDDLHVPVDSELFRNLNQHYNRNNHMPVPEYFRTVIEETLKEFFRAIQEMKDQEPSWKKQIYKVIARLDCAVPDYFKHPQFLERLE